MRVFLLFSIVSALTVHTHSSVEEVYFVKPTEDRDCDGRQPCDTLSGYVEQKSVFQKSNVTIVLQFLPENFIQSKCYEFWKPGVSRCAE